MILRNCNMRTFFERCGSKKIICYGIGVDFEKIMKNFSEYPWDNKIGGLVDNSSSKHGKEYQIGARIHRIMNLDDLLKEDLSNLIIFISCSFWGEIIDQLNAVSKLDQVECYIYYFMFTLSEHRDICIRQQKELLIPPVIHYCWFGGKELPDLYKRCIDSWQRFCPDYQIIEWNEENCDIDENQFAKQAYESGKFGFVPDYFRLKIIYEKGGIYLDTDVEVVQNLDDLRYNKAFCGMEVPGEAALGLGFGAVERHPVIKKMLNRYQGMQFVKTDGTYEDTISPVWQTMDLMELGMKYGNCLQDISGMTIYPVEVLSPKNLVTGELDITKYTYSIHHFDGSWVDGERFIKKCKRDLDVKRVQRQFMP